MEVKERIINPNLVALRKWHNEGLTGGTLEGSSRSTKTWGSIDNLIRLSTEMEGKTFNIVKETYNSFKTTLFEDFNRRLPMFGIQSPFEDKKDLATFWLNSNRVNLLGADSDTVLHGTGSDILYFNEVLDVKEKAFNQMKMRCRGFWWADYNPKATKHWYYDRVTKRKDVGFLKTTFRDNPYISKNELTEILGYQSVRFSKIGEFFGTTDNDDNKRAAALVLARRYDCTKNPNGFPQEDVLELQRCIENEYTGTADDYHWQVYGLGARCNPDGQVFPNVTWIKKFPDEVEYEYYGMDFGYTIDPATIIRMGIHGRNMYLEKLHYGPILNATTFAPIITALGLRKKKIWADSSDPGFISDLQRLGFQVFAAVKPKDSVNYGCGLLKGYKIHIVDCEEWREEQNQYVYAKVNGIRLDQPIDAYNHLWDPTRYAAIMNIRPKR